VRDFPRRRETEVNTNGRSKNWIKNRQHPAMERVMEQSFM